MTMMERVCVAGATGHLGLAVVEELRSRNVEVVAVARNSSSSNLSRFESSVSTLRLLMRRSPRRAMGLPLPLQQLPYHALQRVYSSN